MSRDDGTHAESCDSSQQRPAWAEIDLDALVHNFRFLRRRVGEAGILAVLKADAYGHGAAEVARALEREGADWLGVALEEEGAELRQAGARLPILVLGVLEPAQIPSLLRHRLTPAVSSLEQLAMWAAAAQSRDGDGATLIHLKVDTGMHRLGLSQGEWARAAEILASSPRLHLTGLLSHLAEAEDLSSGRTPEQEALFTDALALFSPLASPEGLVVHSANSAAALHHPASRHSLVRCGLGLYGVDPAGVEAGLRGVMRVRARIVELREVEEGDAVGYGGKWVAPCRSRLGVVALGYADGYPWRLCGRGYARFLNQRLAVVGAINMDMLMLDLTGSSAGAGSEVCLLGSDTEEGPTASELAAMAGTVPYELLCHFGLRLPRRYLGAGRKGTPGSRTQPSRATAEENADQRESS